MEKTYHFRPTLLVDKKPVVLNIRFVPYGRNPVPYPITFVELNVPVKTNMTSAGEIDYFLDFHKSYNDKGEEIIIDPLNKPKLMRVLGDLEVKIDEKLRDQLNGKGKLNGSMMHFKSDNGMGGKTPGIAGKRIYGSPRRASKIKGPVIRKRLS